MSLAVGTRLGPYEVTGSLGAGGMGEVYKARDTRLDRTVAVKVLPAAVAADPDRRARFEREARAVAALSHPYICTLYDVGEHDGSTFLVMELLEGEPLRARLSRARAVVPAIVDTATQLADALEFAHAKGIVHRDIKPENIFITTRGTAKLLDFGVVKLVTEQAAATAALTVTRLGTGPVALGTVAYMSPEQVRGEPLDGRTDLYSLGVVLYEMATGTAPFRGAVAGALLSEILTKAPTAPVRLNPEVPADLERIITKLLERDRALRYQSAGDLRVDLERLRRALGELHGTRVEQASIVVLPFENLSPDPDNAFFADGLTEEVIADLSKIRALRVISRTSAMTFKGTGKGLCEIARELSVGYVLEGSVRRAGNTLRITAQLIDAATDAHRWAEKYTGTLDDVFDLQEKLSRRIVEALRLTLTPAELSGLSERPMNNAAAYECYLRALFEANFFTPDGLARAEAHLARGVEIIGEHPTLLAALAYVLGLRAGLGFEQEDDLARALAYGERVLTHDPSNPHAHAAMGAVCQVQGNLPKGIWHFRQALGVEPSNVASIGWLCWFYLLTGHIRLAAPLPEQMLRLDPINPNSHLMQAACWFMQGRFERAADVGAVFIKMAPAASMFVFWYALILAYAGRGPESRALLATLPPDPGDDGMARLGLLLKCTLSGDRDGFVRLMTPQFENFARRALQSWHLAAFCARLGERDVAMNWLAEAVERGFGAAAFLEACDPFLASLRGEAGFHRLVEQAREKQRAVVL